MENGLLPAVVVDGQRAGKSIAERMRYHRVPGVSVAVIDGGRLAWAKGYGTTVAGGSVPVTPATLFQAASATKPVTAMGALILVAQGKLALDEDVNLRLRSWRVPASPLTREHKVTLRRLASHSAGLTAESGSHFAPGERAPHPACRCWRASRLPASARSGSNASPGRPSPIPTAASS